MVWSGIKDKILSTRIHPRDVFKTEDSFIPAATQIELMSAFMNRTRLSAENTK